jgi:hypothetical protein
MARPAPICAPSEVCSSLSVLVGWREQHADRTLTDIFALSGTTSRRRRAGHHYLGFVMSVTASATYARIINGAVAELIAVYGPSPIAARFSPEFVAACVLLASHQVAVVRVGWTATEVSGVWTFAPPVPPVLTAAQKAAALRASALAALNASDTTVLRYLSAQPPVAIPAALTAYREELRAIVGGTSAATELPVTPAFVPGT